MQLFQLESGALSLIFLTGREIDNLSQGRRAILSCINRKAQVTRVVKKRGTVGMQRSRQAELDPEICRVRNAEGKTEPSSRDPVKKTVSDVVTISDGRGWSKEQSKGNDDPRGMILALYDEYRPKLYRYMCSMRLGRDQAEEIIQETFMRLTNELLKGKENNIENIQGWIVRVAHNLAINLLKRERGNTIDPESAALLIENRPDPSLSPEEACVRKEQALRVYFTLLNFRPLHRDCFRMRAEGFRYKDIGRALGISEQRAAFIVKQVTVRLAAICG